MGMAENIESRLTAQQFESSIPVNRSYNRSYNRIALIHIMTFLE